MQPGADSSQERQSGKLPTDLNELTSVDGRRFALVSLGCAKNTVDSEGIDQLLVGRGFEQVDESSDADLLIVNTCGFIDAARQESIDTLVELGGLKRPGQKLLATGCLTERYSDEIAREIPEVDAIVGARNWQTVPRFARELTMLPAEPRQPGSSLRHRGRSRSTTRSRARSRRRSRRRPRRPAAPARPCRAPQACRPG